MINMGDLMEKNVKILIIICVVLIAGLSLTIGMIMGNVYEQTQYIEHNQSRQPQQLILQ